MANGFEMMLNAFGYFTQCIFIIFLYLIFIPERRPFSEWRAILSITILQKHNKTFLKAWLEGGVNICVWR